MFANNPLLQDRPLLLSTVTRAFKQCGTPDEGGQIIIACPDGYIIIQRKKGEQYSLDVASKFYIKSDEMLGHMFRVSVPNPDGPPARVN